MVPKAINGFRVFPITKTFEIFPFGLVKRKVNSSKSAIKRILCQKVSVVVFDTFDTNPLHEQLNYYLSRMIENESKVNMEAFFTLEENSKNVICFVNVFLLNCLLINVSRNLS